MKWNNTLVTLLIFGLQVIVFTGLHEVSCVIMNTPIAVGSNYFAEHMCMKLFPLLFRVCRSLFYQDKGSATCLHYFQ